MIDVIGIGNAIVDVLASVDDAFLGQHGLTKGAMTLVDEPTAQTLHRALPETVGCSGGSAANTMAGIASLGGSAAYIGKIGSDDLGALFRDDIRTAGVEFGTAPRSGGPPTGRCVVLVTPDAQRTMQTFLGASATLAPEDLDAGRIRDARVLYLEGYLFDPPPAKQAFFAAAEMAHAAGRQVALSLSDAFCVQRHRGEFLDLIESHVDLLFANETEILSLYETDRLDDALEALRSRGRAAAITRGADGSVVLRDGKVWPIDAAPVDRVVDTTGAGDLFASGFLHGVTRERSPVECGRLGGIAAAEIISHFGARPRVSLAGLVAKAEG